MIEMAEKKVDWEIYDHVFFAEMKGKSDVVCLKNLADLIVNSLWHEKREKGWAKESERMINTAAKLILSDNRSIFLERYIYPTENEISDIKTCESLLPESLRKLFEVLIKRKIGKIISRVGNY